MTGTAPERAEPWHAAGFQVLLREALAAAGDDPASLATFAEAGYTRSRYGLRLTLPAGAVIYLQIVAARPPDSRRSPVGTPPPQQRAAALPARGATQLTAVERHLIKALTARQDPLVRWVEPLSTLKTAIPFGLRVTFHNGAVVCCYVVHAVPVKARSPLGGLFPSIGTI